MKHHKPKPTATAGRLRADALTDRGRVRRHNEDSFALMPEIGLLAVADGMGGHAAGAAASKVVVTLLPRIVERELGRLNFMDRESISIFLTDAMADLSDRVLRHAAKRDRFIGMGATVVMALIRGDRAFVANMGDSRAYALRDGRLAQLSRDHSMASSLLREGAITPEQARDHPGRGQVWRYVGMEGTARPDIRPLALVAGDRLLLCTDGLTSMLTDRAIEQVLSKQATPRGACQALVDAANAAGGHDNITALVADYTGDLLSIAL